MWEWLLAPMDVSRVHDVGWHLSWHARFMVAAWGVLVPLGIFIARYFKIAPWQKWPEKLDHHFWWNSHRICQYSATALMLVALGIILRAPELSLMPGPHGLIGWAVVILAMIQIIGGVLRGSKGGPTKPHFDGSWHGDHFDMTPRRLLFEFIHKRVGYIALILSAIAIMTGLWQANGPNWMWVVLLFWWSTLISASVVLQRCGYVVDTYQAIWGPDPDLPGNKKHPLSKASHGKKQQQ